jgi:hypothetical protein
MRLLRPLLAAATLLGIAAASEDPKVHIHEPDSQPVNLFFFADSETALYVGYEEKAVYRSADAGGKWSRIEELPSNRLWRVERHPYDSDIAFALDMEGLKHYITRDQGETWDTFETEEYPSYLVALSFHADDTERILYHGREQCGRWGCAGPTWYTTNGFKKAPKLLHRSRRACIWAKAEKEFSTGDKKADKNRILCVVIGPDPRKMIDHKLSISDEYVCRE